MKFSDLDQLVYVQSPTCASLDYVEHMLDRWNASYGLDLNPDFQRGHVWSESQQAKFIEYLAKGGKCPTIMFNSPVFGGYLSTGKMSEEVVLVDGKQRLTAVLKFINNNLAIFGGVFIDDFEDKERFLKSTDIMYVVNKLQTRKELLQWYIEINEGQVAHTLEEITRVKCLLESTK